MDEERVTEEQLETEQLKIEKVQIEKKDKKRKKKKRGGSKVRTIVFVAIAFVFGSFSGKMQAMGFFGNSSGLNTGRISNKLTVLERCVDKYYLEDEEVDTEKLENGVYHGFVNALGDSYSTYYSKEEYKQLMEEDAGEYKGIGASIGKNSTNQYAEVMEVFKGNPAYNAGIKVGDFILKVNGKETKDMSTVEVVTEIKSTDEPALLTIQRGTEIMEITVEKAKISIETISYEMKENKIGYISVTQFLQNTDEQFIKAVDDLESQGMKGLVIDLRDNGGGMLDTCINMVSRIIPEDDMIVYTIDKEGNESDYTSNSKKVLDIPIVLLVNENSASASEIMTGCLKDYDVATVVGTKTYGKGIVQSILPLSDGSAIKLTVSSYYTPNGVNIHKKGIEPDEVIEMTEEELKQAGEKPEKDKQLNRAYEILMDAQSK